MKGKTLLDVSVLFCRTSFRDENFTSAEIFSASSLVHNFFMDTASVLIFSLDPELLQSSLFLPGFAQGKGCFS